MITLNVFTISGKTQEFLVDSSKSVGDIKNQIQKNHKYISLPLDQEIKLLYKGIELDENKSLDYYNIIDNISLQIIHKTKPISISFKNDGFPPRDIYSGGRRMSESMPNTSIFENYQPSPLDSFDMNKYSQSNSPNINFLADQGKDIIKQIQTLTSSIETIVNRLDKLETRVSHIYESVVIPKK